MNNNFNIEESFPEEAFRMIENSPDGSPIYDFSVPEESGPIQAENHDDFYRNLAEDLDESTLNRLAADLIEEIDDDIASRQEWEKTLSVGMQYLGFKLEEFKSVPFMYASSAYDTTMSSSLFSAWATARAELFPSEGPAHFIVLGQDTNEKQEKGEKNKKLMNQYLTQIDKCYYPDSDVGFLYVIFAGNGIRKVFTDPLEGVPKARFINPQDIIFDNNCTDLLDSSRITHRMKLTKQEIYLRQKSGEFLNTDIRETSDDNDDFGSSGKTLDKTIKKIEGINSEQSENKYLFTYYESHTTRKIKGLEEKGMDKEGFPFPYKVILNVQDKKTVSITRNWEPEDKNFKREECFVHYKYLPGFGLLGLGLMNLMGTNAVTLTSVLRQGIDAAMFANFPGGVKMKGFKMEENDKLIGPGEFHDIETGTASRIQDSIMTFPYKGADATLMALRKELIEETKASSTAAETQISDKHAQAAMGTILALLEKSTVIQSSVMRCMHASLSRELQLIHKIFRKNMMENYNFSVKGEQVEFTLSDFDDDILIIPVSDANLETGTQKMLKAYILIQIAESHPELHNMRELFLYFYTSLGVKNIDKILLPAPEEASPLDPITENMNALKGIPIKVGIWQDDDAHLITHQMGPSAQSPQMMAHMQDHIANKYLKEMMKIMGMQLPSLEQLKDPKIQNEIAMYAAQASQQIQQEKQAQQPPSPEQVMMMDIEQRKESAMLKHEEVKMKVEADSAKAGLQFQADMEKIKAQLEMAEEKNDKDLIINDTKQEMAGLTNLMRSKNHKNDIYKE